MQLKRPNHIGHINGIDKMPTWLGTSIGVVCKLSQWDKNGWIWCLKIVLLGISPIVRITRTSAKLTLALIRDDAMQGPVQSVNRTQGCLLGKSIQSTKSIWRRWLGQRPIRSNSMSDIGVFDENADPALALSWRPLLSGYNYICNKETINHTTCLPQ